MFCTFEPQIFLSVKLLFDQLLQKTLGSKSIEEIKLATLAKSVFMNEHSFDSARLAAAAAIDLGRHTQIKINQSCLGYSSKL